MATSKSGEKPTKAAVKSEKTTAAKPTKTAAKPAAAPAKKPATAAKKTAAAAKPAGKPKAAPRTAPAIAPEQRRYYVEVAAYYIAERRGFHGGGELNDWVQAEQEIDRLLQEGILKP